MKPRKLAFSESDEKAVLGGLIKNPERLDEISDLITENDFYLAAHKMIFSAIFELSSQNISADILQIERLLKEKGLIERTGGLAYLAEIAAGFAFTNLKAHAQTLVRDRKTRELANLGNTILQKATSIQSQDSLDALIEETEKMLTGISLNTQMDSFVELNKVAHHWISQFEKKVNSPNQIIFGTPSGLSDLDKLTAGYQDGDLILLAARPSMGKTALSLTIAKNALEAKADMPLQYYSLEMPAIQIIERFLAMLSGISGRFLRQPENIEELHYAKLTEALGIINQWKNRLILDETPALTPWDLRTRVRRNVRKFGKPSLIIVDYLQLMRSPDIKSNRNLEIAAISSSLKQIAKEINCPVIALSQLNRQLENRPNKRPTNADLRDSGSLEQDADLIQFIYRDEVYNPETEYPGEAEIIIAKHRNGECGTVRCHFDGALSLFTDITNGMK